MKRYAIRDRLTGMWMGPKGWDPEKYVLYTSPKTAMGTVKHLLSPQNNVFQLPELPRSSQLNQLSQFVPFEELTGVSAPSPWTRSGMYFNEWYPVAPCINLSLLSRLAVVEFEVLPTGNSFFVKKKGTKTLPTDTPSPSVPMKAHNHWRGPDYSVVTSIPGIGTFWLSLRDYGVGYRTSEYGTGYPIRRSTERFITGKRDAVYAQLNIDTLQGKAVHLVRANTSWTYKEKTLDYATPRENPPLEEDPFSDQ